MTFFSIGSHEWLLSDTVDILPHLLLPLTGPEEFSEDDMEKLPLDLQYMDENKQRESDPGIRRMLLEALLQVIHMGFHMFVSGGVSVFFFANFKFIHGNLVALHFEGMASFRFEIVGYGPSCTQHHN